jgi:hypothetical protein
MTGGRNITIQIPLPCSQDFTQMPRTGNGFFCGACDKVVTDFSAMSDVELIRFFQMNVGRSVCGVFRNDQLNKSYNIRKITQKPYHIFMWVLATLLAIRLPINAQDSDPLAPKFPADTVLSIVKKNKTVLLRGKVFHREQKIGISVPIRVFAGIHPVMRSLSTFYSDSLGAFHVFLPKDQKVIFYTLVFGDENFQERKVIVDLRKAPKFLPVSILPLEPVEIIAPPVEKIAGGMILNDRKYVTAGVPVLQQEICTMRGSRMKYFFFRIKYRISRLFSTSRKRNPSP